MLAPWVCASGARCGKAAQNRDAERFHCGRCGIADCVACAAAEDGASTPTSPGTASRGVTLRHTGGGDGGGGDGGGGDDGYVDVSDPKSEESVEFVPADDDSDGELRSSFPRVAADSATFGPAEARRAKLKRFLPLVAVFALVALVVLLSALLSTASQAVERGEWALRVGRHNGKLDRRGNFGPGLYWWGPKWRALTLPSTVVPRGFTHQRVLVRSGQNISIDFVVYTRYIRDFSRRGPVVGHGGAGDGAACPRNPAACAFVHRGQLL